MEVLDASSMQYTLFVNVDLLNKVSNAIRRSY